MINQEKIDAYREMAKNAGENSMEAQIRANLESTCDKFAGNEDKFDRCIAFLTNVCMEMLGGEDAAEGDENRNCKKLSGEIPDEVCFRICRDYFNDEIWKAEDEEKKTPEKSAKTKKKAPAKPTNPAPEPEPEKAGTEKPVAAVPEEPVTAETLVKKIAEKNRRLVEANNKKLGIGLAETIDLFGTGK